MFLQAQECSDPWLSAYWPWASVTLEHQNNYSKDTTTFKDNVVKMEHKFSNKTPQL